MTNETQTTNIIIEKATNYAFDLQKKQSRSILSFQVIRKTSIKFFEMLPDDLRDELRNETQRGVCPLDSEPHLNAYMYSFGNMHNAKLRRAYDNLSPEFRQHETIDIVDYGCGQAMGCICYADFLRENGIRQRVRRVVLIEPSELALARAALHVSLLFPDAEIRTVCKGFDDLLPEELCSDADVPTLHILSNVLDLGDKFYGLDKFADLVSGVLKGDNEFVCVGPRYGHQNDLKIAQFMERIGAKTYYATQYRAGELAAGETWTGILCCGCKHEKKYEIDCELSNGLIRVRCGSKYGCIDKIGKVVIPVQFNGIYNYRDNLLKVDYNDKYGLYNIAGKQITPIKYDAIEGFHIVEIKRSAHCHCGGWETCEFDGNEDIRYNYAKVRVGDKWGIINPDGEEITPIKYNCIESIAQANEYWGENAPNYVIARICIYGDFAPDGNDLYIDTEGRERPIYDEIQDFGEGLKLVRKNNKYGLIDDAGNEVTPIKYDKISEFNDEIAKIKFRGKYGYINKTGKEIVSPQYDSVKDINTNLTEVELNGTYGLIQNTGDDIIPITYDNVRHFSEDLAAVSIDGRWGFIDKSGKMIIYAKYSLTSNFSENLVAVELNGKWGFIDKNDKWVIPAIYDFAGDFHEGLADVRINLKRGFIDRTGSVIVPIKYDFVWAFKEGIAKVKLNDKYGFIDKIGREIIPCQYDYAESFSEGLAVVEINHKSWYIDKTGKEIIAVEYEYASSFNEGLAVVEIDGKCGYINKAGKEVIPIKYDFATNFSENLALVGLYEHEWLNYIFIDKTGKEIIPVKEVSPLGILTSFSQGLAVASDFGESIYIDKNGNRRYLFNCEYAENFKENLAKVKINGEWGYINKSYRFVLPTKLKKHENY